MLQLVVPYMDTREMHVRLSAVSQHMQHVMHTHIRQHIATYLKRYLGRDAWLPSSDVKSMVLRLDAVCPSVKWLCKVAGAEAMGTAAAAATVLSDEHFTCYSQERTARVVIEAGKQRGRSLNCVRGLMHRASMAHRLGTKVLSTCLETQ